MIAPMLRLVIPCIMPMFRRLWHIGKADLVLVVMRVADQYLIDVHDNHESKHGDDHGQGQVTIAMQIAATGACVLVLQIEVHIEVQDCLRDYVKQGDG